MALPKGQLKPTNHIKPCNRRIQKFVEAEFRFQCRYRPRFYSRMCGNEAACLQVMLTNGVAGVDRIDLQIVLVYQNNLKYIHVRRS